MVFDPTVWVPGTPANKYEFGDLVVANKDIRCPKTNTVILDKGTKGKVDTGFWNSVLEAHVYDLIVNGHHVLNICVEADLDLVEPVLLRFRG